MAAPSSLLRAGVMGWPVSHSLSPRLHSYWLAEYGIKGTYEALAVAPENLKNALKKIASEGYVGVNLTIPHKQSALALLDSVDELASRIGAVNTVIIRDGKSYGTNTDAYGFTASLEAEMKNHSPGNALVLGAGGAARAVCAGLQEAGWRITLAGRTPEKAKALAGNFKRSINVVSWENLSGAMPGAALLVNTTPLGMKGHPALDIPLDTLHPSAWVYDIVYAPGKTPVTEKYGDPTMTDFLACAKEHGHSVITGLGMLLYQAQSAFEAWFGIRPQVTRELYHLMLASV